MVTLSWLISIADLMRAVGSLDKPTFPFLDPTGKPIPYSSPYRAKRVPEISCYFSGNRGQPTLVGYKFFKHYKTCSVNALGNC
ncbi:hypothetical protein BJX63DRAFT_396046 [Aspergillus granulosus]|uniref:Uncharacterized protein n=1 Tax=Aspergillus granulosus TaxID=176169 RepID=A0ABR4HBB9_9EURO